MIIYALYLDFVSSEWLIPKLPLDNLKMIWVGPSVGNRKRTASNETVPLCGIVEDYRTFAEDFKRVLEFVEWLEDGEY